MGVLFSIPSSSCQIERDFGVSGHMLTTQRTTLAEHNIDMCSFLNRYSDFVDLLQCEEIPKRQHHLHTPTSFIFSIDEDVDYDLDEMTSDLLDEFANCMSQIDNLEETKTEQ